jgi:D-alanine-D-alanine ligase
MIKVGLTFDLKDDYLLLGYSNDDVAEFDAPETIDALDSAISSLGFEVIRIGNIFSLVNFLNAGNRCDLVFNICEGMFGIAREAQVPCLLDAYKIPYVFSEADILNLTLDKGLSKLVLRQTGIPTANFKVISQLSELQSVDIPFPLFVKPVAEGTSKGIDGFSLVENQLQLEKSVKNLLYNYHQPVLVESFLPGREFTVGIIGSGEDTKAIGTMEILLNEHAPHPIYSSSVKKDWEKYASYKMAVDPVALECADLAVIVWKTIKGKDAGRVDFRLDADGIPNFIEVNPLAGLNPTYSDLPILARLSGIPYNQLISEIMNSALKRTGLKCQ